jgi:hypothetical protein
MNVREAERQHSIQNLAFVPNVEHHVRSHLGQLGADVLAADIQQAVEDTRSAVWGKIFEEVATATRLPQDDPGHKVSPSQFHSCAKLINNDN